MAAGEEGSAEAGAEGEDQFHAVALDGAVAGDIGVIAHARRASSSAFPTQPAAGIRLPRADAG
jgi:hypothetical protein